MWDLHVNVLVHVDQKGAFLSFKAPGPDVCTTGAKENTLTSCSPRLEYIRKRWKYCCRWRPWSDTSFLSNCRTASRRWSLRVALGSACCPGPARGICVLKISYFMQVLNSSVSNRKNIKTFVVMSFHLAQNCHKKIKKKCKICIQRLLPTILCRYQSLALN